MIYQPFAHCFKHSAAQPYDLPPIPKTEPKQIARGCEVYTFNRNNRPKFKGFLNVHYTKKPFPRTRGNG